MDRQVPGFEPIIMPLGASQAGAGWGLPSPWPASQPGPGRPRATPRPVPHRRCRVAEHPAGHPADRRGPADARSRRGSPADALHLGEEPDWLKALRDPAPVGATAVPEPVEVAEAATEPEVAEAEVAEPEVVEPEVVDAEIVEATPVEADPQEADAADVVDAEVVELDVTDAVVPETGEPDTVGPADPTPGPPVVEVAAPATPAPARPPPTSRPTPTRSDDRDWLSITRDPGARHVAQSPLSPSPPPQSPPPQSPPPQSPEPTAPVRRRPRVDRLRGPAQVTQVSEPAADPVWDSGCRAAEEADRRARARTGGRVSATRSPPQSPRSPQVWTPNPSCTGSPRPGQRPHPHPSGLPSPSCAGSPRPGRRPRTRTRARAADRRAPGRPGRSAPAPETAAAAVVPTTPRGTGHRDPGRRSTREGPRRGRGPPHDPHHADDVDARRPRVQAPHGDPQPVDGGLRGRDRDTAYLARAAYREPDQTSIAIAAIAAFATAVIWAIRATTVTRLTVRNGQLEVARDGRPHAFDLTSAYTPVEFVGTPGERGWKALFVRRGMPPFVLTSSVVDPEEFTRVVRFYRPGDPT